MGINPRGLVPTLIDNGKVIIESNDITYLETGLSPALIPKGQREEVDALLDFEDSLHMDLRALTMRFVPLLLCNEAMRNWHNMMPPVPDRCAGERMIAKPMRWPLA